MSLKVAIVAQRGDFSLSVEHSFPTRKVTAVVGPNGAGKSTLLEAIAGIATCRGSITLDGRDLSSVTASQRRVSLLKQNPLLFPHLSVKDNIEFGPTVQKRSLASAQYWTQRLQLDDLTQRMPDQLSGGQGARVALARALAADPQLLLLDEPAAALDVGVARSFRQLLASELRTQPITTILVTHTVEDVIALADEVLVLEEGAAVAAAPMPGALLEPECTFLSDFCGTNRLVGNGDGQWVLVDGVRFVASDLHGPVWVALPPSAVTIGAKGWDSEVLRVDADSQGYRVTLANPRGLVGTVDLGDPRARRWKAGSRVQVGVDPTAVRVYPRT